MTILIYNWKDIKNPLVGGAEIITFEYAKRLVAEGHEVTWFCRMVPGLPIEEIVDGVTIVRRGSTLLTYWYGYRYYRSLRHKPDLVIDMLNAIAWQTPLYAAKESKVIQYVNQLAKEVWNYNLPPPFSWLGRLFERLQLLTYHHTPVVTYAPSTAADLAAWGYQMDAIFQFKLGLDHGRYKPGKKADHPLFVQASRMVPNKRPDLTVLAFAQVLKNHPEAKLALVGTGPFKPAIDRLIQRLDITKSVLTPEKDIWFFKEVVGDQKVALMQEAWAFVHPSVKEGWGMVLTEAAACGTVSIATAVSGQVDSIVDGRTGLLVSQNPSVDELANAMERLITDHDLRHAMEKQAIAWAGQFNWDKSYQLFKTALESASALPLRPPEATKLPRLKTLPTISIVTPVFNAESVIDQYFTGIEQTNYPKEKITIIMPDGGSSDRTRAIAKNHGAIVLVNRLKTGEAGKAVGVKYVLARAKKNNQKLTGQIICMLDSDNIITSPNWFRQMVLPFMDREGIIGSEPWEYLYRPTDGYITRYTAMIGMSDPLTMFLGNYDRLNVLTGQWTGLPIDTSDRGDYLSWTIDPKMVPTIGANGTMFRASFFAGLNLGDYLFDIDLLFEYTLTHRARFAKVKIGIVHIFCVSAADFIRKQRRRIKDFHYFHARGLRKYPWTTINRGGIVKFVVCCVTLVPVIAQAVQGYRKKPDAAWLFHPFACWLTLWVYGTNAILLLFQKPALYDRSQWRQG